MFICESSATAPGAIPFPQVAARKSPLETHTLCEVLLRDFPDGPHTRSGRIGGRTSQLPELEKALALAHQFEEAAPETPVILTVHELKRLARNAAELMTLSAELQAGGIQLELLTDPLTGIYDPNGMGATFFAVLAVAGQIERNYIREKTLEDQVIAASKGNHSSSHWSDTAPSRTPT